MRISDWSSDVCSSDLFIRRSLECCGRGFKLVLTTGQPETRSLARQGFNPADAAGHCGFADDLEKAYVAQCRDVRAAAQFNGIMLIRGPTHGEHANFIPVFFPEQSHRARSNGVIRGHQPCRYRFITPYLTVNIRFYGRDLVWRQRLGMGEVEAQTVGRNEATLLRHMPPETLTKSGVKQVRGAVVRADAIPALNIDAEVNGVADRNLAQCDLDRKSTRLNSSH